MMLPKPSAVEIVELMGLLRWRMNLSFGLYGVIAIDGYGDGQRAVPHTKLPEACRLYAW